MKFDLKKNSKQPSSDVEERDDKVAALTFDLFIKKRLRDINLKAPESRSLLRGEDPRKEAQNH